MFLKGCMGVWWEQRFCSWGHLVQFPVLSKRPVSAALGLSVLSACVIHIRNM